MTLLQGPSPDERGKAGTRAWAAALYALLAAGLLLRVAGAWWYRYSDNADYGIVALMARHMAAGRHFPAFFYGQAYMGSFEPAVSAVLCRLFGASGFAICLGSALLSALLLPVVYAWARDAAGRGEGRVAGIAAVAYCLVGPEGFFHYQCSPRGGYPIVLLLGALVLWLTCRTVVRERAGAPASAWRYAGLGVLAGLGVWSNPLIVPALLTAGLVFLLFLGRRAFQPRVFAAIPGFAAGSLPLWVWNARNGWASFAMAGTVGNAGQDLEAGQKLLWTERTVQLLNLSDAHPAWRGAVLGLHLLLLGTAVLLLVRSRCRRGEGCTGTVHLSAAVLFVAVFSVVFALSSFSQIHTPRYLLPLVPVTAVLAGTATACLVRALPRGTGWLPLAILLAWQACFLPNHAKREARYRGRREDAIRLAADLRAAGEQAVYTPYVLHALNFLLEEEFAFAGIRGERYPPLAVCAEQADTVGVLNNHGGIRELLEGTGGTCTARRHGRFSATLELAPPDGTVRAIPAGALAGAVASAGSNVLSCLTDANLGTGLTSCGDMESPECIELSLRAPTRVSGVRLLCPGADDYPAGWFIQGRLADSGAWTDLSPVLPFTRYFWSGPRPYWSGIHFRYECRFDARTLTALRVYTARDPDRPVMLLSELQLLEPGPPREGRAQDALDELVAALERRRVKRLYCDRWEANAVHARTAGRIWTQREPALFSGPDTARRPCVVFAPDTALLVPRGEAASAHAFLLSRGITMRRTPVAWWTLFDFGSDQWREELRDVPAVCALGFTCVTPASKQLAETLLRKARALAPGEEAIAVLEEAVAVYPGHRPAVRALARALREAGREVEALAQDRGAEAMWVPEIPAEVRFANGATLVGVSVAPLSAEPGDDLRVRYYWRCPESFDRAAYAVFVHFHCAEARFQDDHVLLPDAHTEYQPFPEVFVENRVVALPESLPAGRYGMRLGLYSRLTPAKRIRAATALPVKRRAVQIPVQVVVGE